MAKDWEYAKATKWIAEHGGPQEALDAVKNYYMKKGFKDGASSRNPVIAVTGVACLAGGVVGKCIYDKIKQKKILNTNVEIADQAKVKKAERELMTAMEQNAKTETNTVDKPEKIRLKETEQNLK